MGQIAECRGLDVRNSMTYHVSSTVGKTIHGQRKGINKSQHVLPVKCSDTEQRTFF